MLDTPVFKKLAHNDTGKARGHQGGIVIPAAIAKFFPPLTIPRPSSGPTVDTRLNAELFVDGKRVGLVSTRYQYQTWGGTRSPERRLTDNLGLLRNAATKDDILLFSKDLYDDSFIRLDLLRQGTAEYTKLDAALGPDRWGLVEAGDPPVSRDQVREAESYIEKTSGEKPEIFDEKRGLTETTTMRRARNRAFRRKLLEQYDGRCAFTGRIFRSSASPDLVGLDAAHVVPLTANGSDHPANGLLLTKELHWCFDRGMIGVSAERTILVPTAVGVIPGNEFLNDLNGKPIREAADNSARVLERALAWHRTNIMSK